MTRITPFVARRRGAGPWVVMGAALALFVPAARTAPAQEIRWRHDYNTARREAAEQNRPLFLDFGTDNCFWCKKLDAGTFRDPNIIAALNDRFVPLKINASREPALAEILRIQNFPTLVLAAPDGKILETLEGYQEPARLQEYLHRTLASIQSTDW